MKRMPSRREDEVAPVAKRNRFDSASDSFEPQFIRKDDAESAPVLLTFKKFLSTQDTETLTDEEAIAKYVEYKINFKKQECEKYFQEHKDEEWFRLKYHPDESKAYKETQQNHIKKRLEVFNEFLQSGLISKISLDFINAADIIRLMDSVVIKLEGGTDEMIQELSNEEIEDESVAEVAKLKAELEPAINNKDSDSAGESTADSSKPDISTTENGKPDENSNGKSAEELVKKEVTEENSKKKKLHKTCSIHFKTIPANAKFSDLENICKQHPGLLRVGLTDPLPEAKLNRYGWVTYRRDVNIKEIFWSLKNAKLNGTDLGAVVNRDLKRRVRQVSGITVHRTVAQNDIRQAAKLIALYDYRAKLFIEEGAPQAPLEDLEKAIVDSKNPILDGAVDYLVEEASAEEDVLLGLSNSLNNGGAAAGGDASSHAMDDVRCSLEMDKQLLNVLDKYILYLRIVHSVDYYNCGEYVNEDSMPNRMGLIHVRGMPPSKNDPFVKVDNSAILLSKKFVDEFISTLNERLSSTLLKQATLTDEELEKLGKKDADKAVEEFVEQNCVELSKEKWLCPLSGKKFKGPEFIHKHLQSKHSDKLNEVRDEVLYFNNYLIDPHRPRNPDPPKPPPSVNTAPNAQQASNPHLYASASSSEVDRPPASFDNRMGGFRGGWNGGNRFGGGGRGGGYMGGGGGFNNRNRYFDPPMGGGGVGGPPGGGIDNGARRDPRQQIAYRDLDAPEEIF